MKNTKDVKIKELQDKVNYLEGVDKIAWGLLFTLLPACIVLTISLKNMDKKFTERNKAANNYRAYFESLETEKRTARLCKELARVSGRAFEIHGEYNNVCSDSKVAIQTDQQIIDAIAHYALIKTDKK